MAICAAGRGRYTNRMENITRFAYPELLWLLLLLVPMAAYYVFRTWQGGAAIQISNVSGVEKTGRSLKYYARHLPFILRCAAVALLIVALARPQSSEHGNRTSTEGIDIMLVMDVSGSMLARDFKPDRITVAREVASKFIVDRVNDRIGIVVFAGESFTQSPLTTDKRTLINLMSQIRSGVIQDGTAIGNGLATAVNRLKDSDAASKVVILLTDGVNNSGQITPLTAAEIAQAYDIKVYTIGVGSHGTALTPAYDRWGNAVLAEMKVEIDEDVLRQIADKTGGEYFRATDNKTLGQVYDRINELEKTKIETDDFTKYNELYEQYALWALVLLVLEFLIGKLWLRRIP